MNKPKKLRIKYIYAPKTPEEIQEGNKRVEEVYDFIFRQAYEQEK